MWENTEFEDELPPSWEVLWRHWLRSCWVSHFWQQAWSNTYNLLDVSDFGWKVINNCLVIDWDDPRNLEQVKDSVRLLLHDVHVRKDATLNDIHAIKLVYIKYVGLDVDMPTFRNFSAIEPGQLNNNGSGARRAARYQFSTEVHCTIPKCWTMETVLMLPVMSKMKRTSLILMTRTLYPAPNF